MVAKSRFESLRRKILRNARPEGGVEEIPEFRTELGEFDPEVYSQDPLAEDGEFETWDETGGPE